jgi:hypothetical protein
MKELVIQVLLPDLEDDVAEEFAAVQEETPAPVAEYKGAFAHLFALKPLNQQLPQHLLPPKVKLVAEWRSKETKAEALTDAVIGAWEAVR